ncbi:MAG: MBL fold metallo-hydrolase [Pseudomonadota bacterium]
MRLLAFLTACVLGSAPAFAQDLQSHCIALAEGDPNVHYVSNGAGLAPDEVRIAYVGHSTFTIQTPSGLTAATDFTGFAGPGVTPDVVTMNNAHSSHWTPYPDPAIPHVLHGWAKDGVAADHRLTLGDFEMLVRNVPTNVRSRFGEEGRLDGNSIFIFEVAGLCIGHLGHLHHEPSERHYALMGRLDVVMAPVDGGLTLDLPTMIRVLKRVKAQVVLPMHWWGPSSLTVFIEGMRDEFAIEAIDEGSITVSLRDLPRTPVVKVLRPGGLIGFDLDD